MQMPQKKLSVGFLTIFLIFAATLCGEIIRHEIPVEDTRLISYFDLPDHCKSYPLLIALEGSTVQEDGPTSVLRLQKTLRDSYLKEKIGLIMMERRGADEKQIDVARFHASNTPSQRLSDHEELVKYLRNNPPKSWNGKLYILGGSEGGPIAIKLASRVKPNACIALIGCGDQTFKEYIWNHMLTRVQNKEFEPLFPTRDAFEEHVKMMKEDPDPNKWWYGQTFRYWADALDQSEWREALKLECPFLIVAGSNDIEVSSTDRLVEKLKSNRRNVTYLRIEGMGHDVLNPQWNVQSKIIDFLREKK